MARRPFVRGERASYWFAGVVATSYVLKVKTGGLELVTPRGRRVVLPASRCWKPGDRPALETPRDPD